MADAVETIDAHGGAVVPTPADAGNQIIDVERAVGDHIERVANRYGGTTRPEEGAGPTPAAGRDAGLPASPPRSAREIDPRFHERVSRGARRTQELEEENRRYRELISMAMAEPEEPAADAEPDFDQDPKGWYRWQLRQELAPLREISAARASELQQRQQHEQRLGQARQYMQQRAEIMADAESTYAATPEGQGYIQRLQGFAGALFQGYARIHPPKQAEAMVARQLDGMVTQALQNGYNPAVYIDAMIQALQSGQSPAAAADVAAGAAEGDAAAPDPVAARTAQQLRNAAASGVAGSMSRAAGPAAKPSGKVGVQPSAKQLRAALAKQGGGNGRAMIIKQRLEAMERASR